MPMTFGQAMMFILLRVYQFTHAFIGHQNPLISWVKHHNLEISIASHMGCVSELNDLKTIVSYVNEK